MGMARDASVVVRLEVLVVVVPAPGIWTGKRGVWPTANPGVRPKNGNMDPQPTMRYCWTIENSVVTIQ